MAYDYSYENIGRVPKSAALPSSIALYIIAIVAAVLRGFVRWHYGQLRLLDDGAVVFSVILMTASFGLWMHYIGKAYIAEALIYAPFSYLSEFDNVVQVAVDVQVFSTAFITVSVTGIFAIKFSFLFFFRHLIDRVHKLQVYWRFVAIYTTIVFIISVCIAPIACPFYDARAIQCAQGTLFQRAFDVSVCLVVFDVTTDALIITIPIILIRQIKIPLKSKIWLAMSLCLSAVTMVVAILQGATITYEGVQSIDVVWELYFQFIELTLAVLVVSLTAFRTLFVGQKSKTSRPSTKTPENKKWYSGESARKAWKVFSSSSGTTASEKTAFDRDIPLSNGPLPTMIQPDRTDSHSRGFSSRKMSEKSQSNRKLSERKFSDRETGLSSHPTTFGGSTLASHSDPDPEPLMASTMNGPMMDMPMAFPVQTPEDEHEQIEPEVRQRPQRPRSDISAERRISYWQRMIRIGVHRAQAVIPGRSNTPSLDGRRSRDALSRRESEERVSPIGPSPERSPVRETV